MLLNDFSQADQRLAYLLGLHIQRHQGRRRSRRAGSLVLLSASALVLLCLWTLRLGH
jgi:hypothetical protein